MAIETEDFAQEQKKFLQTCAKYLPGPGAKKAFEDYAHSALEDYRANCPDCIFSQAAEQIGGNPYDSVQNFLESQSPEMLAIWQNQATKRKRLKVVAVVGIILLLIGITAYYFKTNGVLIVNTETTVMDVTGSNLTDEELAKLVMSTIQKEEQQNG